MPIDSDWESSSSSYATTPQEDSRQFLFEMPRSPELASLLAEEMASRGGCAMIGWLTAMSKLELAVAIAGKVLESSSTPEPELNHTQNLTSLLQDEVHLTPGMAVENLSNVSTWKCLQNEQEHPHE